MTLPRRRVDALRSRMAQSWHKLVPTGADLVPTVGAMDATGKWNDARLDEFAQRTEENFREVRTEIRDEVGDLCTGLPFLQRMFNSCLTQWGEDSKCHRRTGH